MLVIARHNITDPDKFWSMATSLSASIPAYLRLHSVIPSRDKKNGTCIWEAASVKDVQQFLDEHLQSVSQNSCYEVDQEMAMGLPVRAMEAFNN